MSEAPKYPMSPEAAALYEHIREVDARDEHAATTAAQFYLMEVFVGMAIDHPELARASLEQITRTVMAKAAEVRAAELEGARDV